MVVSFSLGFLCVCVWVGAVAAHGMGHVLVFMGCSLVFRCGGSGWTALVWVGAIWGSLILVGLTYLAIILEGNAACTHVRQRWWRLRQCNSV